MASSPSESSPPSLEELSTRGATALLLPWILGMAAATNSSPREVAVFVHQPTRSITLVEGSLDVESLIPEITSKEYTLPASKASIESLPRVQISEPGWECAICLAEDEANDGEVEVKEMPCRHKFHSGCIDKWLGIHGSCPICRFSMPVEEEKDLRGGWRIHVFLARGRTGSGSESDMDVDTDTGRDEDREMESRHDGNDVLPAQDME